MPCGSGIFFLQTTILEERRKSKDVKRKAVKTAFALLLLLCVFLIGVCAYAEEIPEDPLAAEQSSGDAILGGDESSFEFETEESPVPGRTLSDDNGIVPSEDDEDKTAAEAGSGESSDAPEASQDAVADVYCVCFDGKETIKGGVEEYFSEIVRALGYEGEIQSVRSSDESAIRAYQDENGVWKVISDNSFGDETLTAVIGGTEYVISVHDPYGVAAKDLDDVTTYINDGVNFYLDFCDTNNTVSVPGCDFPTSISITIDLNGKILNMGAGHFYFGTDCTVTFTDSSTAKTGKIVSTNCGAAIMQLKSGAKVILDGVTLEATNSISDVSCMCFSCQDNSSVEVKNGGKILCSSTNGQNAECVRSTGTGVSVTVNGAELSATASGGYSAYGVFSGKNNEIVYSCDVTVINGTITATSDTDSSSQLAAAIELLAGTVNVSGSSVISANVTGTSTSVYSIQNYSADTPSGTPCITISGGTITGNIHAKSGSVKISNAKVNGNVQSDKASNNTVSVSGGTVTGDILATAGSVRISNATVNGNVQSDKVSEKDNNGEIENVIYISGTDGNYATVNGNVLAPNGRIYVVYGKVDGNITAGNADNANVVLLYSAVGSLDVDGKTAFTVEGKSVSINTCTVYANVSAKGGDAKLYSCGTISGTVTAVNGKVTMSGCTTTDISTLGSSTASTDNRVSGKAVDIYNSSTVHGNVAATEAGTETTDSGASVNASTIDGNVTANGTVNLTGATVTGNVESSGSAVNASTIDGNVTATGAVSLTGATVKGNVESGGSANVSGGTIGGLVKSTNGSVFLSDGCEVSGNVEANGGTVSVKGGGSVSGYVKASGNVHIGEASAGTVPASTGSVGGSVSSGSGSIKVIGYTDSSKKKHPSTVGGDISASGGTVEVTQSEAGTAGSGNIVSGKKVIIKDSDVNASVSAGQSGTTIDGSTVTGNVDSTYNAAITGGSTVNGNVSGSSGATVTSSTVKHGVSSSDGTVNISGSEVGTAPTGGADPDIVSGTSVTVDGNSTINAHVNATATNGIAKISGSTVNGNVSATLGSATVKNGSTAEARSTINGTVSAKSGATVENSTVKHSVSSTDGIVSIYGSTVGTAPTGGTDPDIVSGTSVTVDGNSTINAHVNATATNGTAQILGGAVNGNVNSQGEADLSGVSVTGDVKTDGSVTVNGGTVGGKVSSNNGSAAITGGSTVNGTVSGSNGATVTGSTVKHGVSSSSGTVNISGSEVGTAPTGGADPDIVSGTTVSIDISTVNADVTAGNGGVAVNNSTVNGSVGTTGSVSLSGADTITKDVTAGADVTVSGEAKADGNVTASGDAVVNKGKVTGNVTASSGTVKISGGSEIGKNVLSKQVSVSDSTVNGNVAATGADTTVSGATVHAAEINHGTVYGDVTAQNGTAAITNATVGTAGANPAKSVTGKTVSIDTSTLNAGVTASNGGVSVNNSIVNGSVGTTGSDVEIKGRSTVNGNVDANGSVSLSGYGTEAKDVTATGDATLTDGAQVTGDLKSSGNVKLTDSVVYKNVESAGNAEASGSVVNGNVTTGGNAQITGSSNVVGTVTSDGDVTVSGSGVGSIKADNGSVTVTDARIGQQANPGKVSGKAVTFEDDGSNLSTVFADVDSNSLTIEGGKFYGTVTGKKAEGKDGGISGGMFFGDKAPDSSLLKSGQAYYKHIDEATGKVYWEVDEAIPVEEVGRPNPYSVEMPSYDYSGSGSLDVALIYSGEAPMFTAEQISNAGISVNGSDAGKDVTVTVLDSGDIVFELSESLLKSLKKGIHTVEIVINGFTYSTTIVVP